MIHSARSESEIRITLPANLQAVEAFFGELRLQHGELLTRVGRFAVELLLREALTNSVLHGCRGDSSRFVRCVLRLNCRRLLITVQDDGDGFDWHAAWANPIAFSDGSGRGIAILRKYADHVRYNDRGNLVAIVKRLRC